MIPCNIHMDNYYPFISLIRSIKVIAKKLLLLAGLLGLSVLFGQLHAQDIHFSQFLSSPMNLNPALTGDFDGSYRFAGNGRRQWSSVTIPYQTFGLSADANNFLRLKNVGAGLSMYQDKTGDSRFSTFLLNASLSYRIKLNKDSTQFIMLGAQSGFTSRRIDYNNLRYDNQFNGLVYDPSIAPIEEFQNAGRIYPNLNGGIQWMYKPKARTAISAGFSLYNILTPKQSFYGDNFVVLDHRYNIHVSGQAKLSERFDLLPNLLFMTQGTFRELVAGTSVKYILNGNPSKYRAVYVGGSLRARDAAFATIGMDYQKLYVGLSYDLNFSNLTPASNYRGGIEFAVIYILDVLPRKRMYKICPVYI